MPDGMPYPNHADPSRGNWARGPRAGRLHARGAADVPVRARSAPDGSLDIVSVTVGRTARRIFDRELSVDEEVLAMPAKPEASRVAA